MTRTSPSAAPDQSVSLSAALGAQGNARAAAERPWRRKEIVEALASRCLLLSFGMAARTAPAHSHWSGVEPGESFVLELEYNDKYAQR